MGADYAYPNRSQCFGKETFMTIRNDSDSFTAAGTSVPDGSSSSGATEHAKQAAGTAAEETQHVAGVAAGEAQRIAVEAKSQVQQLLGEATSQMEDQSRTQRDRVVSTLHTLTDDLEQMAGGASGGMAAELVRGVADQARTLTNSLEGREPRELLDEVRGYARRKPGTFLLGALAAGIVAGRVTRGARTAQSSSFTSSPAEDPPPNVHAAGVPPVGTSTMPGSTHGTAGRSDVAPLAGPVASDPRRPDPLADPLLDPLPTDAVRADTPNAQHP